MADKKNEQSKMTGADKAAILIMSLGEQHASEVLRHIGPKEVHKISASLANIKNIQKDQAGDILAEFNKKADNETSLGVGSQEYLRKVLVTALGEDKATSIIDRVMMGGNISGLEQLKWLDPRGIVEIIKLEHPQIIAVILSYLENDLAAEVLSLLPENIRTNIILRIATLDGIQPSAIMELNDVISKQFVGKEHVKSSSVGGIKTAANILNMMDVSAETNIIEEVTEHDAELADKIQDLMFVFDDLVEVDDRGMQSLLREVSSETLILAMKGADERLKNKIFGNMSKRASEMLRDDLEAKGPVRLSDVEAAQKEILTIARRLSESGELSLGGKGAEEFI